MKNFDCLLLHLIFIVVGSDTLTIDTKLGTSVEDCFERISIGDQLPSNAIYRNITKLTSRECEQLCKHDGQCQAFDYGVGAKGNATCNLSKFGEKEIKENKLVQNPDYDVFVRRFQCEQSPPNPIQTHLDDSLSAHKPVFRPIDEEAKSPVLSDNSGERLSPHVRYRPKPNQNYNIDAPYDKTNRPVYQRPDHVYGSGTYGQRRPMPGRPENYQIPDYEENVGYGDHRPLPMPFEDHHITSQPYKKTRPRPDRYDILHFQDFIDPSYSRPYYYPATYEYRPVYDHHTKPSHTSNTNLRPTENHYKPIPLTYPDNYNNVNQGNKYSEVNKPITSNIFEIKPQHYDSSAGGYGQQSSNLDEYSPNNQLYDFDDPSAPHKPINNRRPIHSFYSINDDQSQDSYPSNNFHNNQYGSQYSSLSDNNLNRPIKSPNNFKPSGYTLHANQQSFNKPTTHVTHQHYSNDQNEENISNYQSHDVDNPDRPDATYEDPDEVESGYRNVKKPLKKSSDTIENGDKINDAKNQSQTNFHRISPVHEEDRKHINIGTNTGQVIKSGLIAISDYSERRKKPENRMPASIYSELC